MKKSRKILREVNGKRLKQFTALDNILFTYLKLTLFTIMETDEKL